MRKLLCAFPPPHLPAVGQNPAGASVSNHSRLWLHSNIVECQTDPADAINSMICLSTTPGLSHGEFEFEHLFSCPDYNGAIQARPRGDQVLFLSQDGNGKKRQPVPFCCIAPFLFHFKIYIWNWGWVSDFHKVCTLALYWGLFCGEFLCSKALWILGNIFSLCGAPTRKWYSKQKKLLNLLPGCQWRKSLSKIANEFGKDCILHCWRRESLL